MKVEQRRRLTDLYARGEEVNLAPEGEAPFPVWVRNMTPADAEVSYLKASARRASVLALGKEQPPSDLYLTLKSEVESLSRENLVLWVTTADITERRAVIEARVGGSEEWSKERYLVSLQERYLDEDFTERRTSSPEDPEVLRVTSELERFQAEVDGEIAEATRIAEQDTEELPVEELFKRVLESMVGTHADAAWLAEFQRCQIWRCVYEAEDHSKPLFNTRAEVDAEQVEIIEQLKTVIDRIHVPDIEGKGLGETQDSSSLSE